MEFHEVANIFPMMTKDEFKELVGDIRQNGLIQPITTYQNKIIDGRNRYLACQELDIEPDYQEWNGKGNIVNYVVSLNLKRRHLNESQRGMVADKLANIPKHQHKSDTSIDVSQDEAAKMLNVSVPTVQRARQVREHGTTELAQAVESGDIKVSTAAILTKLPKEEQKEVLDKGKEEVLKTTKRISTLESKERNRQTPKNKPTSPPPEPAQPLLPLTQYQKDKELVDKVMWEATKRGVGWTNPEVLKKFNTQGKPLGDARIYVAMIDKFPEMSQYSKYKVLTKYKELPEEDKPVLTEPGLVFDGFSEEEQQESARMERFMLDVDKLVCDLINEPENTYFNSWKKFSGKFGRVERTRLLLDRVTQLLPILEKELGGY